MGGARSMLRVSASSPWEVCSRPSSPEFWVFLLARAIQAAGAGGIFPVATAAVADKIAPERRGCGARDSRCDLGLGRIIGPGFGGMLTHYLVGTGFSSPIFPLAVIVIPWRETCARVEDAPTRTARRRRVRLALSTGILAVMVGLTRLDTRAAAVGGNGVGVASIIVALVAFVVLARIERKAAQPVLSVASLRQPAVRVTYGFGGADRRARGRALLHPLGAGRQPTISVALAGGIAADRRGDVRGRHSARGARTRSLRKPGGLRRGAAFSGLGLAFFGLALHQSWGALRSARSSPGSVSARCSERRPAISSRTKRRRRCAPPRSVCSASFSS